MEFALGLLLCVTFSFQYACENLTIAYNNSFDEVRKLLVRKYPKSPVAVLAW